MNYKNRQKLYDAVFWAFQMGRDWREGEWEDYLGRLGILVMILGTPRLFSDVKTVESVVEGAIRGATPRPATGPPVGRRLG